MFLQLVQKEIESNTTGSKAKGLVSDNFLRDYNQPISQDFESSLGTII